LRIDTVQLAHAYRKIPIRCINEQMVMLCEVQNYVKLICHPL
jgi:hypothetical protein